MRRDLDINIEMEIDLIIMKDEKKKILLEIDNSEEKHSPKNNIKILMADFLDKEIKSIKIELEEREKKKAEDKRRNLR